MMFGARAIGIVAFATSAALVAACSSSPETTPSPCDSVTVAPLKELLIVDEAITSDVRAKNATDGAWSFRNAIENLVPAGMSPSAFVTEWLTEWDSVREMNGFPADRPNELRGDAMHSRILCPWLKSTPANACDDTCGKCVAHELDLAKAPFRLMAIANRLDERETNPGAPQGEGRILFALTNGPADDESSAPMPMTLIFEYHLAETRSLSAWAETWHKLGAYPTFDEGYKAELESVTNAFVKRGSRPSGIGGSALNQLRTNESALNWIWQLREFGLTADGRLKQRSVRNTPGEALNGGEALARWVRDNAATVRGGRFQLPVGFQAPTSDQLLFTWRLPGVDEPTRIAFSAGTCNGCHSIDKPRLDTAFHVSPFRKGNDKISPFLLDPHGGPDELTRRASGLKSLLCAP